MEFTILFITILFISLIQIAVPFLVKRTVVFGVAIPYEQTNHPKVKQFKRRYAISTCFIALIVLLRFFILKQGSITETKLVLSGVVLPFVLILASLSLYFYFHYKTTKIKKSQHWFEGVKQVRVADLSVRLKDEMLPSVVHFIPVILTISIVGLTIHVFDQLPNQVPTHWGPNGQPDDFTTKSWMTVLNLPIMLFVIQIMFFEINAATKNSGIKLSATNINSAKRRQLNLRKYSSWFLLVVNILMTMLFSFMQLSLLYENLVSNSMLWITPLIFFILILAGSLILAIKVGSTDSDLEGKVIIEEANQIEDVDEDQNWKGGLIYFNPNDPSVFVEKRFGIGFTLNFANPRGYFIIFLPIVIILLMSFTM
ncbi:DUF1648 domain-containing protein [Paraliobacillus ryukyuensis]|uniref:DUF1648 domain-containing protein n=1 Tax=Paraliobacillus ryukyuensis TaxID=200904 RepID=UPI0009A6C567|nr:DUF5808 domain-containing protein [Paraliobacillus ryukyuensis]